MAGTKSQNQTQGHADRQALAYAVEAIDRLPPNSLDHREGSGSDRRWQAFQQESVMSDIVERLREANRRGPHIQRDFSLYREAADEIVRLRAENERLRAWLDESNVAIKKLQEMIGRLQRSES
jgi:hypothetical protein